MLFLGSVRRGDGGEPDQGFEGDSPVSAGGAFFNGKDLTNWAAAKMKYWSVEDGAIVGHTTEFVRGNQFLWSTIEVDDFYLSVDVKIDPPACNAGIQFRSKSINDAGQAHGYQADIGGGSSLWGKLYHEHGRGKLDWNNKAAGIVKEGDWNRLEILAVGDRIWTAVNGTLCTAVKDPEGEAKGRIALQIHGGPPQTVRYRINKLVHNPKVALGSLSEAELQAALFTNKPALVAGVADDPLFEVWAHHVDGWADGVDCQNELKSTRKIIERIKKSGPEIDFTKELAELAELEPVLQKTIKDNPNAPTKSGQKD
jgi:hypothetical protein